MDYVFISVKDYVNIYAKLSNEQKKIMPIYISTTETAQNDNFIFCDQEIYQELLKLTKNFTSIETSDIYLIIEETAVTVN